MSMGWRICRGEVAMRVRRFRSRPFIAVSAVIGMVGTCVVGFVPAALAAPGAADLPSGGAEPVIVVLADQHDETPATAAGSARRRTLAEADQRPLVERARRAGATGVKQFSVINGF